MASIIGKKIRGKTYYYLREVARVKGKPKIVSQRYLGTAAEVLEALEGSAAKPERTRHLAFGLMNGEHGLFGKRMPYLQSVRIPMDGASLLGSWDRDYLLLEQYMNKGSLPDWISLIAHNYQYTEYLSDQDALDYAEYYNLRADPLATRESAG